MHCRYPDLVFWWTNSWTSITTHADLVALCHPAVVALFYCWFGKEIQVSELLTCRKLKCRHFLHFFWAEHSCFMIQSLRRTRVLKCYSQLFHFARFERICVYQVRSLSLHQRLKGEQNAKGWFFKKFPGRKRPDLIRMLPYNKTTLKIIKSCLQALLLLSRVDQLPQRTDEIRGLCAFYSLQIVSLNGDFLKCLYFPPHQNVTW